jgi:hypothetical protein
MRLLKALGVQVSIFGLLVSGAFAKEPAALLPLPQFERCASAAHPLLPEKWRAVYLMAPFARGQLVLSEIEYDGALDAMHVRLHGVQRGSANLLVIGRDTYEIGSEGSAAASCRHLGDTGWRALGRDWLRQTSQCVGSAPIGDIAVEWWKTPIAPEPASYWVWYKTSDRSPFRLVFASANSRLSPFGHYALSYQVEFQALDQSNVAKLAAACREAKRTAARHGARAIRAVLEDMDRSADRADAEIKRMMPTLDSQCPDAPFPTWPEQLAITGWMTPVDSDEDPYPAEVLYDWTVPGQRSRIFGPPGAAVAGQDFLLLQPHGYTVTYHRSGDLTCKRVLPGTIRPDWMARGDCSCAAVINGTTPLSPHGTTRIVSCPLAAPRSAWAWYALSGRPTTFMVTSLPGDEGKGLFAVLDYRDWLPNHAVARSVFEAAPQCHADRKPRSAGLSPAKRCSTCHSGASAVGN